MPAEELVPRVRAGVAQRELVADLAEKVRDFGYELTLSDARTYTRYKFFRGHFDLATSVGLDIRRVETLPRGSSDHLPILVDADYAGTVAQPEDVVI